MIRAMGYPGGKGKCYQHVINLIPPHATYIESHLGGGAVLRHKTPSVRSIAIDLDPRVIHSWRQQRSELADYQLADAGKFLAAYSFCGNEVVYSDPPYLPCTRRRSRVYRFDYSEEDHRRLLAVLRSLPCAVIVSGYPSKLYGALLQGWRTHRFRIKTHFGVRTEMLWFNFAPPRELHDPRYLGRDFREREVVRRRLLRLKSRLARLSAIERSAIRRWLDSVEAN
jgi:DNA adenine methylase